MKYEATVTAIGDSVLSFMKIRDSLILFDKDVPPAYENMVISHTKGELAEDIVPGDRLIIADREYTVTDVGQVANQTLREHGHVTLVFNQEKTEMPGQIALKGGHAPRIMIGDVILFIG